MKHSKFFHGMAVVLTSAGLSLPPSAMAESPVVRPADQQQADVLADIALAKGGVLRGQVVDAQNKPVAGKTVSLRSTSGQEITATTNDQGYFMLSGLRGGTYAATTEGSTGMFRLWAADTAPPSAIPGVMLMPGREAVRGQNGGFARGTLIILGITGAIVAVGLASDDDPSS